MAGIAHYRLDKGIVVTNNYFTSSAVELAGSNGIVLWDRSILKEKSRNITEDTYSNRFGWVTLVVKAAKFRLTYDTFTISSIERTEGHPIWGCPSQLGNEDDNDTWLAKQCDA